MNMKTYIGTKIVKLKPMTRAEWCAYRGWALPVNENGADAGYLVEYTDGGKPNVAGHDGYVSWTPKEQADAAYRETSGMSFGLAVEAMKKGARLSRTGWNGPDLWLEYRHAQGVDLPFIRMSYSVHSKAYPEGARVPWAPSQTDVLADDWTIVQ